jgi:formyl-CoA transferase
MAEAVADPQIASRGTIRHFAEGPGIDGPFAVPVAGFRFAHDGPSIETPPPQLGADTDAVLTEFGYKADELAEFRRAGVI